MHTAWSLLASAQAASSDAAPDAMQGDCRSMQHPACSSRSPGLPGAVTEVSELASARVSGCHADSARDHIPTLSLSRRCARRGAAAAPAADSTAVAWPTQAELRAAPSAEHAERPAAADSSAQRSRGETLACQLSVHSIPKHLASTARNSSLRSLLSTLGHPLQLIALLSAGPPSAMPSAERAEPPLAAHRAAQGSWRWPAVRALALSLFAALLHVVLFVSPGHKGPVSIDDGGRSCWQSVASSCSVLAVSLTCCAAAGSAVCLARPEGGGEH